MSQISEIMEKEDVRKGKARPTLVRRVSDMFKDGSYSGPPMLFRHASMQRIRHCCQNLNLLSYLLYSFDNSKSHPLARKAHTRISRFLRDVVLTAYGNLRQSVLRGLQEPDAKSAATTVAEVDASLIAGGAAARFGGLTRPRRKQNPLYLVAAVYLVPLLLVFQVATLCSLTILSKYNPGFIFLAIMLCFLGGIALKILFHGPALYGIGKCGRKKVQ